MATRDTYTEQEWENLPSENTPVTAERLEHIEDGIKTAMDNRALKEVYEDYRINLGNSNQADNGGYFGMFGTYNQVNGGHSFLAAGSNLNISGSHHGCFGYGNTVSGSYNIVSGQYNTVGGASNIVSGQYNTTGEGYGSAFGYGNIAKAYQHVTGRYNTDDVEHKYVEMVGNGTSDTARSNARTLDWQGNAWYAGDVTNGQGVSLNSLKESIDQIMAILQPNTDTE